VADRYRRLPLEQRIGALCDGDVTHHGEPVGSTPLTVQPPRRLVVADDLTDTTDELLLACQRARDEIRARFWLAQMTVKAWRLVPMPEGFERE